MARSRRRTISRQRGLVPTLAAGTWIKWLLVALGVGGGSYGVFSVVNTLPSGAVPVSEGVEVGPHSAELAMAQKPALPDESATGRMAADDLGQDDGGVRVASRTAPIGDLGVGANPTRPNQNPADALGSAGLGATGLSSNPSIPALSSGGGGPASPPPSMDSLPGRATGGDSGGLANRLPGPRPAGLPTPNLPTGPSGNEQMGSLAAAGNDTRAGAGSGVGAAPASGLPNVPRIGGGPASGDSRSNGPGVGAGLAASGLPSTPIPAGGNSGLPSNELRSAGLNPAEENPAPRSENTPAPLAALPSRSPSTSGLPSAGLPNPSTGEPNPNNASSLLGASSALGASTTGLPANALGTNPSVSSPSGGSLPTAGLPSAGSPLGGANPSGVGAGGSTSGAGSNGVGSFPAAPALVGGSTGTNSLGAGTPPGSAPLNGGTSRSAGLSPMNSLGGASGGSGSIGGGAPTTGPVFPAGLNSGENAPAGSPPSPLGQPAPSPVAGVPPGGLNRSGSNVTGRGIGIPAENRPPSASPGTAMNSGLGNRTAGSAGLPPADPLAGMTGRTAANSTGFNPTSTGTAPTGPAGAINPGSFNPPANASGPAGLANPAIATMVSNRPGDPQWEIQQQAALVIEKLAPPTVQVNVPATFTLVVRNVGRAPANQVLIRDRVPAKARLIQVNPKPTRQVGDLLEWEVSSLSAGETFQMQMECLPLEPGEIGSVAQVMTSTVAAARTRSTRPELSIQHTAPQQVMVGQPVLLNIMVRNDGDGIAENVIIREIVPAQLMHPSGEELENPIGNVLPGQTKTLQLSLVARTPGQVRNTIRVTGEGKLSAEHSVDLQVVAPQLQVSGDGPEKRFLSRAATHEFKVKNMGTANATNVQMMARLPQGLRYESSSPAGQYDPTRHAVFWAMSHLPSNAEQQVSVTTMPMAPGEQKLEFQALADLNQPQGTTRTMVVEQLSELFFDIDDLQDPIEVGTKTMYVIRVENQGSQVANNVAMVIDIPAGIEPLGVESPIEYQVQREGQGSRLVFAPIPTMNPRSQLTIRFEAQGNREGDHLIEVRMTSAQRPAPVAKQESTKVYADR